VRAASLRPSGCISQAASGWVRNTIGVGTPSGIVKPFSAAISDAAGLCAGLEIARPQIETAVSVSLSPTRVTAEDFRVVARLPLLKLVVYDTLSINMRPLLDSYAVSGSHR
jgi:hypothetical protein